MLRLLIVFIILLVTSSASTQTTFKARVTHDKEPLIGATVLIVELKLVAVADSNGIVSIPNVPSGKYSIRVSYTGFEEMTVSFTMPATGAAMLEIELEMGEEEEEVIIRSTRSSRTIRNIPSRVETINGEEIDEKNNMRPANVSMLLHESTGIQVQQTSATSANASIRIQGLDGRYTQLLRDGFPSFGNFAGGLSVLEIPPLDLKQVEVIKGPASTLYGGGAIAGVVNFITLEPGAVPLRKLLLNQSNIGQTNLGGFISQRNEKTGFTLLANVNRQLAYDVDDDDFSELP
ncbi:MAG: TonB-dependent receptor plug domain-containing protein, partial [Chitinophagaceae bacterium]|nr:TonB-dependent receptor plug domain-containing protein [Chitinophagaceae bacterium]